MPLLKPIKEEVKSSINKKRKEAEKDEVTEKLLNSVLFSAQDRELSDEEINICESAKILSIERGFRILKPLPGRLGYLLRNYDNEAVIEILRVMIDGYPEGVIENFDYVQKRSGDAGRWIRDIIRIYERLDYHSQQRIDVFDWLCKDLNIQVPRFWGTFQEAATLNYEAITKSSLEPFKPVLLHAIARFAMKEKNFKDRELLARMLGMDVSAPSIHIEDKSVHVNVEEKNQQLFSNFAGSIRRNEVKEVQHKQLTEGSQDFIDAEYSSITDSNNNKV